MDLQTLQKHVLTLVTIGETDAPMVSCYLNLESGAAGGRQILEERVRLLRKTLPPPQRAPFEQALGQIDARLEAGFDPHSVGAAIFSRGGGESFFLDLEFRVPLPTSITVNSTPNIYHLVELKDTYDRYVVVLANEQNTRILEIHLGSVTEAAWTQRPELRERIGKSWTREHYQSHRREQSHQYANEISLLVDSLVSEKHYGHLFLAGNPKMTAALKQALPKRLASKLIDVVPVSTHARTSELVRATLARFIEEEQQESLAAVDRLEKEIYSHGLAVTGSEACLQALQGKQVDWLVMATEYAPEPGWICADCRAAKAQETRPAACPACGSAKTRDLDVKEELVRLAELAGCGVEIVHDSEVLMRLGGVGCLLRFHSPDSYGKAAA